MNAAMLAHAACGFPIKLPLSKSMNLLSFLPFSHHPTGERSQREAVWVFGCRLSHPHRALIDTVSGVWRMNQLTQKWALTCSDEVIFICG